MGLTKDDQNGQLGERRFSSNLSVRLDAPHGRMTGAQRLFVERMPLAYIAFDAEFRITDWNPAAERIFGYTKAEMLGIGPPWERFVPESFHPGVYKLIERIRCGDMESHSTNENLTKDGRTILCEWFNTPLVDDEGHFTGMLCMAQDVTERKRLAERLEQSQKMESIGHLAGGIAHDFNNLLTVIIGACDLLKASRSVSADDRLAVGDIDQAAERAAALTRQLLAFSRKQVLQPTTLDLNAVVNHITSMLLRLIQKDILFVRRMAVNVWPVRLDSSQIEQVLVNLVVNARDAMPEGGELTVETANVEWSADDCRGFGDRKPGRYVMLAVADNGLGISPDIQPRIFDPFFTTKEVGKGTGLGLAVVHGIVKQSEGYLAVESTPGRGTRMMLFFPAARDEKARPAGRRAAETPRGGSETLLLVEDEEAVRGLIRRNLERHGYTVLDAGNGQAALDCVDRHAGPLDLVITDVAMPVMGGRQLAQRLTRRFPGMKVLFVTGYTGDVELDEGLDAGHPVLRKPFAPAELIKRVRALLDGDG